MSYIFQDLKTKLQTQVGDPNLTDSVAGDALNYTQQYIFNTFDLTLNSANVSRTVTTGTHTLSSALPSDLQRISSIYVTAPTNYEQDLTLYFVPIKEFRTRYPDPSSTANSPLREWSYFTEIEFGYNADQTHTLSIDYVKSIPIMTATSDVPLIPEAFEELLILGAKMRIYEQKEDFDYANQFTNRYADALESFTTRYSTRQVDNQMVIPGSRHLPYRYI